MFTFVRRTFMFIRIGLSAIIISFSFCRGLLVCEMRHMFWVLSSLLKVNRGIESERLLSAIFAEFLDTTLKRRMMREFPKQIKTSD